MSQPAAAVDSKTAPLLEQVPVPAEAPPSYSETSKPVIGNGNVYSVHPQSTMMYATGHSQPYVPRSERQSWSFGFFDCLRAPGAAFKAFCCPCVSYAQTRHRLLSPDTQVPVISTPCLGYCTAAICLPGSESIFGLLNRNDIRNRLGINQAPHQNSIGDRSAGFKQTVFESLPHAAGFMDDALRHAFCGCCALVQEDREVTLWQQQRAEENGIVFNVPNSDEAARDEDQRLLAVVASELGA